MDGLVTGNVGVVNWIVADYWPPQSGYGKVGMAEKGAVHETHAVP